MQPRAPHASLSAFIRVIRGSIHLSCLLPVSAALLLAISSATAAPQLIQPGAVWPDDRGQHIQSHGGGVLHLGETYYWFDEDRAKSNPPGMPCVSCYASQDLVHWTHRGQVLKRAVAILERPKVFYNAKTKKFVMYLHVDGPVPGQRGDYNLASVGVATCDTVDGQYQYLKTFRPLGQQSRDLGQFVDDDGTPYLIFEDRPHGFHIAALSDDYLDVARDVCLIREHLEGGAIVHYEGLYYVVGSHLSGWNPNPNVYATAKTLSGPWSKFQDLAPPKTNTYGSQSTMLVKVLGTKTTSVIFMADVWKPKTQWDSRYLWMPLEIGGGKLWVPEPRPWTLDVTTGEAVIAK